MIKLAGSELRKLIREELTRQLLEQADSEVKLSPEAQSAADDAARNIEKNNSETMASVTSYMETTPGIDHTSLRAALEKLQAAQTEIGAAVAGPAQTAEGDEEKDVLDEADYEMIETIRKIGDEYVVYPKSGGRRLGTHSSRSAAKKQLAAIEINKKG